MIESQIVETITAASRTPLSEWSKRHPEHRAMGYLCSYVPEEIIHAAGYTPVRIRGNSAPLRQVDAHLQSFTCALCRSSLDQALAGELDFVAGMIFAHTCDTMQAQADLWRMNTDESHLVDTIMQPANLGTGAARRYLVAELDRLCQRLSTFAGRSIDDDDLRASIALYDESRRLVQAMQDVRDRLSAPQFFAILDAAQIMPREEFNPLLALLLDKLQGIPAHGGGPRIFLVGAVLDEPRLLDMIEEMGARVVGDDLCSGSRHFSGQVGVEGDPIAALAEYYLQRPPCPTKLHPTHEPGHYLLEEARRVQAHGIIFTIEKFCEPHAFDYALALPALDEEGLPHLLLEMEQTPSLEALRTRLQAFVEML
jgi:bzd-type benzoyl-CoA reductase N subunit